MTDAHLPAPRSLLDRPQRLGVLPTLWFWNDADRQWLVIPIILSTAVPLTIAVQLLVVRFPALSSPLLLLVVLYPFLLMGLVERHIRRHLADPAALLPANTSPPSPFARAVPVVVGVTCAVLLALATLEIRGAMLVAAVAGGSLAIALLPHTRRALDRSASATGERTSLPPAGESPVGPAPPER
ncbi:hypothetical protein [Nannocystis sp. SCPEA4]|uniref:hypothetical protein n=1 Tax=Nannocystis sp. SCPEA4 TaxID=2996787 RepID=UPI002271CE1F|nr:hypothetical protein [Nannocystis sp. SCPEA4]MCY1059808.1 hypothetical protein [Nannocystis sp. SCPEA4]